MNFTMIDTNGGIVDLLSQWKKNGMRTIALDIEAESNLHQYGEKLCLVQIFDGKERILIDPFQIKSMHVKKLLESPEILKIMYDASSDLSLLKNAHDMEIRSILDLRPAVELLELEKRDLHSVIGAELDVKLEKKSKYQRYNWTRRPLPDDVIDYALNDVEYLFRLKESLMKKIFEKQLLDDYMLKNLMVQIKEYKRSEDHKYKKIKGYDRLHGAVQKSVRMVYDIRDSHARKLNVPPNDVFPNKLLIDIARGKIGIDSVPFSRKMNQKERQQIMGELEKIRNRMDQ